MLSPHLPYSSPSFSLVPCWSQQMLVFYRVLASNSATSGCTCDPPQGEKINKLLEVGHASAQIIYSTGGELWHEGHPQVHQSLLCSVQHCLESTTWHSQEWAFICMNLYEFKRWCTWPSLKDFSLRFLSWFSLSQRTTSCVGSMPVF